MKSPRLPHYFHLPIALVMLLFSLSVIWTISVGMGSWTHNQRMNLGWLSNPAFLKTVLMLLPIFIASCYFLISFFRRKEVNLFYSLLVLSAGFSTAFAMSVYFI
jgi:hypothetical protein